SLAAAGSVSALVSTTGTTSACPPPPPPALTVSTNVADGSTLSGSVTWTATPSAAVAEVDFLVDGTQKWVEKVSPYQYNGDPNGTLDTTTLSNGSHTLTAVAIASGLTATKATTVTVSNTSSPTPNTTGTLKFDAGWETDNTSQWTWGMQCVNT